MGVHRLGHAISLGVNPVKYGSHSSQETAGERIDQLSYDLRHKEGLLRRGVTVDGEAAVRELAELRRLPEHHLLSIEYDEHRLNRSAPGKRMQLTALRLWGQ